MHENNIMEWEVESKVHFLEVFLSLTIVERIRYDTMQ